MELITLGAQYGFPALMAVLIWKDYRYLVKTLVDVVQRNTTAFQELRGAVSELDDRLRDLEGNSPPRRRGI